MEWWFILCVQSSALLDLVEIACFFVSQSSRQKPYSDVFFISIAKRVFKTMNFFLHYGLNKIQQKIEFIDINQEILKKITIVFGAL